jgi:hypothetical protein
MPKDRDTPLRRVWHFLGTLSLVHWLVVAVAAVVSILATGFAQFPPLLSVLLAFSVFGVVVLSLLLAVQHVPALAPSEAAQVERAEQQRRADERRVAINEVRSELKSIRFTVAAIRPLALRAAAKRPLPAIQWDRYREVLSRELPTGSYDMTVVAYERANQLNAEIQRRAELDGEDTVAGILGSDAHAVREAARFAEDLLRRALPP